MTEQHAERRGSATPTLFGAFFGVILALITGVVPVSAWIIVPSLLVALAAITFSRPVRYDRLAAFGGVLIGAGAFYVYGAVTTVAACVGTADFCGRADVIPVALVAGSLLATGSVVALVARGRARA